MFLCSKHLLYSRRSLVYLSEIRMLSKFRIIYSESIVKISRGIVELDYEVKPLKFLEV